MSTLVEAKREARGGAGRPNAEEAERKRLAVLESALSQFADCGFNAASLRVIASKAEVSTRTLLNHYPTKATLFAACIEHISQRFAEVVTIRRPTLADTLIEYGMAMQESLSSEDSRKIAMLIYRESAVFEEVREIARLQFEAYQVAPVVRILSDFAHQSPDLREPAIQFVAMAFGKWQRRLLLGGPPISTEEARLHFESVTRTFLYGIGGQSI